MSSQANTANAKEENPVGMEQEGQTQAEREKVDSMMAIIRGYLTHPHSLRLAQRACYDFLAYQNILKTKPTPKQAEAQLGRLRNKMKGLLGQFAKVNPVILRDLDEALYSSSEETFTLSPLIEMLEKLSLLAENPEPWLDIPTTGVRPTNKTFLRDSFIRTMATAYEKEKLTPALDDVHSDNSHDNQWGNFYELIWGCLAEAGHSPESGIDLENAIRKKLNDRTPRISPWSA